MQVATRRPSILRLMRENIAGTNDLTESDQWAHPVSMHRLSHADVVTRLFVALKTAPRLLLKGMQGRPDQSDDATDKLAHLLAKQVSGESSCVIQTDPLPNSYQAGKFGVDEPWPCDTTSE